jgi:hypothetical protein
VNNQQVKDTRHTVMEWNNIRVSLKHVEFKKITINVGQSLNEIMIVDSVSSWKKRSEHQIQNTHW